MRIMLTASLLVWCVSALVTKLAAQDEPGVELAFPERKTVPLGSRRSIEEVPPAELNFGPHQWVNYPGQGSEPLWDSPDGTRRARTARPSIFQVLKQTSRLTRNPFRSQ